MSSRAYALYVDVTGRFLGVPGAPINVTINAGERQVVEVPKRTCAAPLHIDPPAPDTARGPVSALVEYSS